MRKNGRRENKDLRAKGGNLTQSPDVGGQGSLIHKIVRCKAMICMDNRLIASTFAANVPNVGSFQERSQIYMPHHNNSRRDLARKIEVFAALVSIAALVLIC